MMTVTHVHSVKRHKHVLEATMLQCGSDNTEVSLVTGLSLNNNTIQHKHQQQYTSKHKVAT